MKQNFGACATKPFKTQSGPCCQRLKRRGKGRWGIGKKPQHTVVYNWDPPAHLPSIMVTILVIVIVSIIVIVIVIVLMIVIVIMIAIIIIT